MPDQKQPRKRASTTAGQGSTSRVLKILASAILANTSDALFIKRETYDVLTHTTCGPPDTYNTTEFIGCQDHGVDFAAPFTCTKVDDPFYGKYWAFTNTTYNEHSGLYSIKYGRCDEPTCSNGSVCKTSESYVLESDKPGDILRGQNCSLAGSLKRGVWVRYTIISSAEFNRMLDNPPPTTTLVESCFDHQGQCAEAWQMWPVHGCEGSKETGSSTTTCDPVEKAVVMKQWPSSDTCEGDVYAQKYYMDRNKTCGLEGFGYVLKFCTQ